MFLPRKCMFKDSSFFHTLVQSETMLQFPEISLEVDGLRKICVYCLKGLILVQVLL